MDECCCCHNFNILKLVWDEFLSLRAYFLKQLVAIFSDLFYRRVEGGEVAGRGWCREVGG